MVAVEPAARLARRVVGGPFGDPAADEVDLDGVQGRLPLGHRGNPVLVGHDLREEQALVGLAGDDRRLVGLAPRHQAREVGHDVVASPLGGLVATLATPLQDRANLLVEADPRDDRACFCLVGFVGPGIPGSPAQTDQPQQNHDSTACSSRCHRQPLLEVRPSSRVGRSGFVCSTWKGGERMPVPGSIPSRDRQRPGNRRHRSSHHEGRREPRRFRVYGSFYPD